MVWLEFCYKQLWYLVGKDLTFNRNWQELLGERWWPNYNHFQIFHSWRRPYLGKIEKKLKLTPPHVREPITAITTIQLLIRMWFFSCTCHSCNGTQCQTSGTIHLTSRTGSKTYDDEGFCNLSTDLALNFIFELFFLCAALRVWVLLQSKFHKGGGGVTCRRSRLMQRKCLTG